MSMFQVRLIILALYPGSWWAEPGYEARLLHDMAALLKHKLQINVHTYVVSKKS